LNNQLPGAVVRQEDGLTILELPSGLELRFSERLLPPIKHGRRYSYGRGCRCKSCVAANSEYMRARRQRAKATA
jgi:hypothetical protein